MQGVAWGHPGAAAVYRAPLDFRPDGLPLQEPSPWRTESLRAALQEAAKAMGAQPAAGVRVLLADGVVRYWLQAVPQRLGSLRELQAVAGARCGQLYGGGAAAWHVAGDWQARGQFVCAAVPHWIMAAVMQAVPGTPHVSSLVAQCLRSGWVTSRRDGWLCLTLPGTGVLLSVALGRIASLRVLPLPPHPAPAAVLDLAAVELQREALRTQRPLLGPVAWLALPGQATGEHVVRGVRFQAVAAPAWAGAGKLADATDDAGFAAALGLNSALWSGA